jgi:hypothetical protein
MDGVEELTGGLHVSLGELLSKSVRGRTLRVDLDQIPEKVPQVKDAGIRNVMPVIKGFADKLARALVSDSLIAMGLSCGSR